GALHRLQRHVAELPEGASQYVAWNAKHGRRRNIERGRAHIRIILPMPEVPPSMIASVEAFFAQPMIDENLRYVSSGLSLVDQALIEFVVLHRAQASRADSQRPAVAAGRAHRSGAKRPSE